MNTIYEFVVDVVGEPTTVEAVTAVYVCCCGLLFVSYLTVVRLLAAIFGRIGK